MKQTTPIFITLIQKFSNEDKAREYLEQLSWPDGPICPHCGADEPYRLTPKPESKTRKGLLKCKKCRKQFTVTVGTIFEDSRIPLGKWLIAIHLLNASKKGMSAHQMHRMLGITYKSTWFMMHRIREAMSESGLSSKLSGTVECDETYIGGKAKNMHAKKRKEVIQGRGPSGKTPVFSLVERGGRVRSQVIERVTGDNLKTVLRQNVELTANLMTDEFRSYSGLGKEFASHEVVKHKSGEYVRGSVYTNTVESYFALLKRGVMGTYHHWSKQHLHRYLSEFDFRYNLRKAPDTERAVMTIKGAVGKRLFYKN